MRRFKSEYLSFIATMIKAPVFYVHGNHDTNYVNDPREDATVLRIN